MSTPKFYPRETFFFTRPRNPQKPPCPEHDPRRIYPRIESPRSIDPARGLGYNVRGTGASTGTSASKGASMRAHTSARAGAHERTRAHVHGHTGTRTRAHTRPAYARARAYACERGHTSADTGAHERARAHERQSGHKRPQTGGYLLK